MYSGERFRASWPSGFILDIKSGLDDFISELSKMSFLMLTCLIYSTGTVTVIYGNFETYLSKLKDMPIRQYLQFS